MEEFLKQFEFQPKNTLLVGIERESFLADRNGQIIPIAEKVIQQLGNINRFGYELSACQLEDRIGPVAILKVKEELQKNDDEIAKVEQQLNFKRLFHEVAPEDMPLDVYPDPTGRYQRIVEKLPKEILQAACRVIATHIHIGMPDHETALAVYNKVIRYTEDLCQRGDGSNGERLQIYAIMEHDYLPPYYPDWQAFYKEANHKGFTKDPRTCWHLIRLSVHGTIEFRMFGATQNLSLICNWAEKCHSICLQALRGLHA